MNPTGIELFSPRYFLPIDKDRGLCDLLYAFIALYPFVDSLISIAKGNEPQLSALLEKYSQWRLNQLEEKDEDKTQAEQAAISIPELDSYTVFRPGLWWSILARDQWICCSCGRGPSDGVKLEVDHKIPRSKGGTNDAGNLQTLCKKCNIGKSNKDSTDLNHQRTLGS